MHARVCVHMRVFSLRAVPDPPTAVHAVPVGSRSVDIGWVRPAKDHGIVHGYTTHLQPLHPAEPHCHGINTTHYMNSSEKFPYKVITLCPNVSYLAKVRAHNRAGAGAYSSPVRVLASKEGERKSAGNCLIPSRQALSSSHVPMNIVLTVF